MGRGKWPLDLFVLFHDNGYGDAGRLITVR
jgi:hypothetical protein